jgi:hypothetical protein
MATPSDALFTVVCARKCAAVCTRLCAAVCARKGAYGSSVLQSFSACSSEVRLSSSAAMSGKRYGSVRQWARLSCAEVHAAVCGGACGSVRGRLKPSGSLSTAVYGGAAVRQCAAVCGSVRSCVRLCAAVCARKGAYGSSVRLSCSACGSVVLLSGSAAVSGK